MSNKPPRIVRHKERYTAPGAEAAETQLIESSGTAANMSESVDLSRTSRFTIPGSAEREAFYANNAIPIVPPSELHGQDYARQILVDYDPSAGTAGWIETIDRANATSEKKRNKGIMQAVRHLFGSK